MTNRTQTKLRRQIHEQVGVNPTTGKAIMAKTNEFMPPQSREWIVFTAADGRKCGTWAAAGQVINIKKFFKKERHFDNEKQLWV